jgi:hypothetical protein
VQPGLNASGARALKVSLQKRKKVDRGLLSFRSMESRRETTPAMRQNRRNQ